MALTDENGGGTGMVMPVQPMGNVGYGYGGGWGYPVPVANYGGGFGNGFGFGGDGSWLLLLILLCGGGWGFGGGFGGFGGMMGTGMMDGFGLYPWMNQLEATQAGFNNQATNTALSGIQSAVTSGFGDVQLGIAGVNQNISNAASGIQNSLCNGFAGVNQGVNNGFAQAEIANNARQIANMQQAFNAQTAVTSGISGLSSQFADCCCENRLGLANLNSTILSENCADRAALSDGVRDLMAAGTGNTQALLNTINGGIQSIKDQLCQDKIDAKNETIQNLRDQLNMANLSASQTAQTARLLADNAAQTQQVENYIRPQINPAYVVPNPYAGTGYGYCGYGNGCGCNG